MKHTGGLTWRPVRISLLLLALLFPIGRLGGPIARSPSMTPTPQPCWEAVVNGSFESLDAWQVGGTARPASYTQEERHSGLQSIRLGIPPSQGDVYTWSSVRQWVTIPADATFALLSFWYKPYSEELSYQSWSPLRGEGYSTEPSSVPVAQDATIWSHYDWQECLLLDEALNVLAIIMRQTERSGLWTQHVADLTPYRGRRVALYFNVFNNGSGGRTWMYLDDVSLQICGAGQGSVSGRVILQGRARYGGAQVSLESVGSVLTGDAGDFLLAPVPAGSYRILASLAGYLSSRHDAVTVTGGQTTVLPNTELLGGDANGDQVIGLLDLVTVAIHYGAAPPQDSRADINADGRVDLTDLVLVACNYSRVGPTTWGVAYAGAAKEWPGGEVTIQQADDGRWQLVARDLRAVYAFEIRLRFDPKAYQIAETLQATSLESGHDVYVVHHEVNEEKGEILYVAALLGEGQPLAAERVLLDLPFQALSDRHTGELAGQIVLAGREGDLLVLPIDTRLVPTERQP